MSKFGRTVAGVFAATMLTFSSSFAIAQEYEITIDVDEGSYEQVERICVVDYVGGSLKFVCFTLYHNATTDRYIIRTEVMPDVVT